MLNGNFYTDFLSHILINICIILLCINSIIRYYKYKKLKKEFYERTSKLENEINYLKGRLDNIDNIDK